jgi:hypothetical protein
MSNSNSSSGGIGISGLLFVAFVVLKLTNVIDWSWWWVTAPIWIPIIIAIPVLLVVVIFSKGKY